MYKRILLAVDDSENSERASQAAIHIAGASDSTIVLFHAYHVPIELAGLASQFATSDRYLDTVREGLEKGGEGLLDKVEENLQGAVGAIERVLTEGRPGPSIVDALDAHQCEVVVIGKRGRGRVRELLLGSESDYVIHHAKKPVFIVP